MEINLFAWIRESVKHAVLAGVHDAVGQLGKAHEADDMPERLLTALRTDTAAIASSVTSEASSTSSAAALPKPRRLGRSLGQIAASEKSVEASK